MHHLKALLPFIFLFAATLCTSCTGQVTTVKNPGVDLTAGKLVYDVSGNGTTDAWEFEVVFNPGNVLVKEAFDRNASRKYAYNKEGNEVQALFNDITIFGSGYNRYFIYYTPEELVEKELSSNYGDTTITLTQEYKDIAGFKCRKSIIKHGEQVTVEVWTTDKIKTGLIYPWTPLTFEQTALEYEIKILGKVDRHYIIRSISDEKTDGALFDHNVPDGYYQVVPAPVFSLDSIWAMDYKEKQFKSFSYPCYGDGRETTRQYLQTQVARIINKPELPIAIAFTVKQNGEIGNIEVNYGRENEYTAALTKMLKDMPKWTPGKVKGKPVDANITLFI